MCHKLVALHVWTHTGGRFEASGSIFLAIVCGNYFAVCCTRRAAPKKFLKHAKSWSLRDDQSGKSRTLP